MKISLKQIYTAEDLKILEEIISKSPTIPGGREYACSLHRAIVDGFGIRHILYHVFPKGLSKFARVFLRKPLEEAPLYINDPRIHIRELALWRLSIGK